MLSFTRHQILCHIMSNWESRWLLNLMGIKMYVCPFLDLTINRISSFNKFNTKRHVFDTIPSKFLKATVLCLIRWVALENVQKERIRLESINTYYSEKNVWDSSVRHIPISLCVNKLWKGQRVFRPAVILHKFIWYFLSSVKYYSTFPKDQIVIFRQRSLANVE